MLIVLSIGRGKLSILSLHLNLVVMLEFLEAVKTKISNPDLVHSGSKGKAKFNPMSLNFSSSLSPVPIKIFGNASPAFVAVVYQVCS